MSRIVIAADAQWLVEDVTSTLSGPDTEVIALRSGAAVLPWLQENDADAVLLDLQIGSMGALAVCQELRLEETYDRLDRVPVLILLDRRPDVFMARRVDAQGWLIKPLDPIRLRRAVNAVLAGDTYYDPSFAPTPMVVSPADAAAGQP